MCRKDWGVLFIGDVFDLDKKTMYEKSVRDYALLHESSRASKSFAHELFVPMDYWYDLSNTIPEISGVEITEKIGKINNEINNFRYDVIMHVSKDGCNRIGTPKLHKYQLAGE